MSDLLVDWQIRDLIEVGRLAIVPFSLKQLQGQSYDVRLGPWLEDPGTDVGRFPIPAEGYHLAKHEFLLGSTVEVVTAPPNMVVKVEGKSSRARDGLTVEAAGHVDGGFSGQITLEMNNQCSRAVILTEGMLVAQITFTTTATPDRPYGHPDLNSKYMGQIGPTRSRKEAPHG